MKSLLTALLALVSMLMGAAQAAEVLPSKFHGRYVSPASEQSCEKPALTVTKAGYTIGQNQCRFTQAVKDADGMFYKFRCPKPDGGYWFIDGRILSIDRGGDAEQFVRCNS